ncbi:VOC family protein [Alkalicoccobacillus porphyridii]|uniref:VOC family protein n=1 Tax=Alkalicoccobacillus porphyridii TaxID=2597270 RepID=A0A554A116_9BACI|nr:VOC family protein [Alkalicoccobacillus porphyridii]TSB47375.1 VOC family protein [Alkalicoccobacillus porphyridii]
MVRIGAVFIPVFDVQTASSWYENTFGLNLVGVWPEHQGADFYFNEQKQYVTLVKVNNKPKLTFPDHTGFENSFYNFTVENLEDYHSELKKKSVKVTEIREHGPIKGFDFFDCEDNQFSIIVDV